MVIFSLSADVVIRPTATYCEIVSFSFEKITLSPDHILHAGLAMSLKWAACPGQTPVCQRRRTDHPARVDTWRHETKVHDTRRLWNTFEMMTSCYPFIFIYLFVFFFLFVSVWIQFQDVHLLCHTNRAIWIKAILTVEVNKHLIHLLASFSRSWLTTE